MSPENPKALLEEFKRSGEFDRLRKELLLEFQKDGPYSAFKGRIEEIVRQRLAKAQMLHYLPQDMVRKELSQEVERYPVVERAVADLRMLSEPNFLSGIQSSLQKVLEDAKQKEKGKSPEEQKNAEQNEREEKSVGSAEERIVDERRGVPNEPTHSMSFEPPPPPKAQDWSKEAHGSLHPPQHIHGPGETPSFLVDTQSMDVDT